MDSKNLQQLPLFTAPERADNRDTITVPRWYHCVRYALVLSLGSCIALATQAQESLTELDASSHQQADYAQLDQPSSDLNEAPAEQAFDQQQRDLSSDDATYALSSEQPENMLLASNKRSDSSKSTPLYLDTIEISALRKPVSRENLSKPVHILNLEDIDSIAPRSVAQAVEYQSNVTATGAPRASNTQVNIRGLGGSRVLQTIDGVRQIFESGHRPSYFLDTELLKSIEIVKGPSSSIWGSGALGGVVAQQTIDPSDLIKAEQNYGGYIKTGHNNNNDQQRSSAAIAGEYGEVQGLASIYYSDQNDIELGSGRDQASSGGMKKGTLLKAYWTPNEHSTLKANYRHSAFDGNIPANASAELSRSNGLLDRDQQTDDFSVRYQSNPENPLINSDVLVYHTRVDIDEESNINGRMDSTEQQIIGLNASNISNVYGAKVLYGIDGRYEDYSGTRSGLNRTIPPDARTENSGAFVEVSMPVLDNVTLELGARYDYFEMRDKKNNLSRTDDDVSPSAAVVYTPSDWAKFSARYDQAFRSPSAEELFTTGTHFCLFGNFCNRFIPNPDLDSERAENIELATELSFSQLASEDDQLIINMNVFRNRVDDFIEQRVTPPTFFPVPDAGNSTWVNIDKATLEGFEVAANYSTERLATGISYGRTRGENESTHEDIENIPADKWVAYANYQLLDQQLLTGLRVRDYAEQDQTRGTNRTDFDGYTLVDLHASYQPQAFKALTLNANVNNLTDRDYRQAWSELSSAGREVIISAKYEF